jgi:hypothetical protein
MPERQKTSPSYRDHQGITINVSYVLERGG